VVLPALLLLGWRRLGAIDTHADVPVVEVALLRSVPIFEPLGPPALEGLARELQPMELTAGERVVEEGDPGERYYVVADGTLEVARAGVPIATVGRGGGVGEASLLAGVPCTATVTARKRSRIYALEAETFVTVVTEHPACAEVAGRLVGERV
jgi:CRP-like cAMP-binding protein